MASINLNSAVLQAPDRIQAALSCDWEGMDLPQFHLEPSVSIAEVKRATFKAFARSSAYFIDGKDLHFYCSGLVLAQNQLNADEELYVAGQFNGWEQAIEDVKWRMERVKDESEEALRLSLPLDEIDLSQGTGFKFITRERRWFSLPSESTNTYADDDGNPNYYIDPRCAGRNVFDIKTAEALELSQDYFLSQQGHESSTLIRPGSFFLDLDPALKPGVFLHGATTLFRLFAPRATQVRLVLLDHPDSWGNAVYHSLQRLSNGMWEADVAENVIGKYYWYRVDGPSQGPYSPFDPEVNILDPYALATVGRNGPAIVVDRVRQGKPPTISGSQTRGSGNWGGSPEGHSG